MANLISDLYIDESGSFDHDDEPTKNQYPGEMSLVGGLMISPSKLNDELIQELIPEKVHCCNEYKKSYITVLEKLRSLGGRLIIFENREQLKIINGDTTYLNIISEGLVQLFRNMHLEYPNDKLTVRVTIATRKAMSGGTGVINTKEYKNRLEEKLLLALHRSNIPACEYTLDFRDARYFKKLDFADIICNTYLTRNRKKKFNESDRTRIGRVYDKRYVYSVFENATVGYLKQLMSEKRFGEMMVQFCAMKNITGLVDIRNKMLKQLEASTDAEINAYFGTVSLQIGVYNDNRDYNEGILFAENFKKLILSPLEDRGVISKNILSFQRFDTDFYILTMYDHIGNAARCATYQALCNSNIQSINHSWEHIDYYFKYRIREMNCMIGRFDFDGVLQKVDRLIKVFQNAKELFSMIETFDGTSQMLQSELLGKAYGIKLEAYNNLLPCHPELLDKAIEISDLALSEFTKPSDLRRQYMYRCISYLAAEKTNEALEALFKAFELNRDLPNAFTNLLASIYGPNNRPDRFALWHYTNIMFSFSQEENDLSQEMYKALMENPNFANELKSNKIGGYPWNLVLWNLSRWLRKNNSGKAADDYYDKAIKITKENPDNVTMYAFSNCMIADLLLYKIHKGQIKHSEAEKEMLRALTNFNKLSTVDTMVNHFAFDDITSSSLPNKLKIIANSYLR